MSLLTLEQLKKICTGKISAKQTTNMKSLITPINLYGHKFGFNKKYNLASFIGQVMVESGEFKYDREIWGPTAQQKKYEGRKDLGNTVKGDGSKFRGYGPIQLTGRKNVTAFYKWALANYSSINAPKPPDFTKDPSKITSDPWEGLSAIWYWDKGNPEGTSLNKYAKDNNQLMVTRRVNGGTTHFEHRLNYQTRAALVLLGYGTSKAEIIRFQKDHPLSGKADGLVGDKTRDALHLAMGGKLPVSIIKKEKTRTDVAVPVALGGFKKPWYKDTESLVQIAGGTATTSFVSFLTDADTTKVIVVAVIAAIAVAAWYFIRKSKIKVQDQEIAYMSGKVLDTQTYSSEDIQVSE